MIHVLTLALLLAQVDDSPQEFINRYRARGQSIQTGMVRSTWEDFGKGKPQRRDRQTIYFDTLGRVRLQMQSEQPQEDGTWAPHEQVPYEWDQLFDGSLTASMTFDPRKDRVGNAPQQGTKAGYRTAQIFDGEKDIRNQRTPLAFADGIITVLESALKNRIPVEVKSDTETQAAFRFADDKDGEFWSFEVDKTRDWIPTMIARVDQSGKAIMRTDFEYAATNSGFWYPKKAVHRYFHDRPESETPLRETRFEVTECRINEPDFDEEIFQITLHPDTAVFDSRYGVNYRIGTENTYTNQLAALAQTALDAQKVDPDGMGPRAELPERGRNVALIVWINIGVIALFAAYLARRRWMAK